MISINIHGDNIVECERAWMLVKKAIFNENSMVSDTLPPVVSPKYVGSFNGKGEDVRVQFYPGYLRWSTNILNFVRDRGAMLREATDAIISILHSESKEKPLIAIEFCGALAAGNQAWQRCGRGYAFASAGIPYFYLTEIGGFELDSGRKEKSVRFPNPVVPFSYLTLTKRSNTPALPIFTLHPSATGQTIKEYGDCLSEIDFLDYINKSLLGGDLNSPLKNIANKTLEFVNILSDRRNDSLKRPMWGKWLSFDERKAIEFLFAQSIDWSKTAYIQALTDTVNASLT